MWDGFYNAVKSATFVLMLLVFLAISIINLNFDLNNPFVSDVKGVLVGVFVGLVFSFLLAIRDVRSYILKSISHFMSDSAYLDKLNDDEIATLKEKVANRINGIDVVTNKESLFNYLNGLDRFMTDPHKSISNESWIYEYHDKEKGLVKVKRSQNFRVHSLDLDKHKKYCVKYKSNGRVSSQEEFDKLKENIYLTIEVDGEGKVISDSDFVCKYEEASGGYSISLDYDIDLKEEYTRIKIESERIEALDGSIAFYSLDATYCLNYNLVLPEDIKFCDIYHSNTMDLDQNQTDKSINGNKASVNINGWQLPGLIFVATYERIVPVNDKIRSISNEREDMKAVGT